MIHTKKQRLKIIPRNSPISLMEDNDQTTHKKIVIHNNSKHFTHNTQITILYNKTMK